MYLPFGGWDTRCNMNVAVSFQRIQGPFTINGTSSTRLIMGKSSKGLKATLHAQQGRLKKDRAVQQAQKAKIKEKGKAPRRPTIPFRPTDRILLVGEGNFSFARALVCDPPEQLASLPPSNITATAYDTEDECYAKYPEAKKIVETLREKGVQVMFRVDATQLENRIALKKRKWDRIVWNFPHAGAFVARVKNSCSAVRQGNH